MMYDTMTIHAAGSYAVGENSCDEMRSERVAVHENITINDYIKRATLQIYANPITIW